MAEEQIDPQLVQRVQDIASAVAQFIEELENDEEFAGALLYVLGELVDHIDDPLLTQTANLWAASIIYSVAEESDLLEPNPRFHLPAEKITEHFKVGLEEIQPQALEVQRLLDELEESDAFDPLADMGFDGLPNEEGFEEEDLYSEDYEVQDGEFIDELRDPEDKYLEVSFKQVFEPDFDAEAGLRELIDNEPDYLFPYLDLAAVYFDEEPEKANEVLQTAVGRAEHIIFAANDGGWPRLLEYGRINNRHLLSAYKAYAINAWINDAPEQALDVFRGLLSVNPLDEPNIRFYIAAIREGLSLDDYLAADEVEDEDDDDILSDPYRVDENRRADSAWFQNMETKYPDEFAAWRQNRVQREKELGLDSDPFEDDDSISNN